MGSTGISGREVREARNSRGISQEKLARLASVSVRTVARFENGQTVRGHARTRQGLANALGLHCPPCNGTAAVEPPSTDDPTAAALGG